MGKFVKSLIKKGKDFGLKRKAQVVLNAKSMSKEGYEKIYSIYFWAMDGFIKGNPSKRQVRGWKIYVIPGIDTEFNKESKERAEDILKDFKKDKYIIKEDSDWVEFELKPYFENSLKIQTGKSIDLLSAVDEGKMKEFLSKVKKEKEGRFK